MCLLKVVTQKNKMAYEHTPLNVHAHEINESLNVISFLLWTQQWTLVSIYMLWVRQPLYTSLVSPHSLVIMGLEKPLMAAMLLFKPKRWALQPIDWRRSRVAPSIMEMQNTQWCGGTMWGHFIHTVPLSPFSEKVWGGGGTAIPEGTRRSYVRKFRFIAWSLPQQFVLIQLYVF